MRLRSKELSYIYVDIDTKIHSNASKPTKHQRTRLLSLHYEASNLSQTLHTKFYKFSDLKLRTTHPFPMVRFTPINSITHTLLHNCPPPGKLLRLFRGMQMKKTVIFTTKLLFSIIDKYIFRQNVTTKPISR